MPSVSTGEQASCHGLYPCQVRPRLQRSAAYGSLPRLTDFPPLSGVGAHALSGKGLGPRGIGILGRQGGLPAFVLSPLPSAHHAEGAQKGDEPQEIPPTQAGVLHAAEGPEDPHHGGKKHAVRGEHELPIRCGRMPPRGEGHDGGNSRRAQQEPRKTRADPPLMEKDEGQDKHPQEPTHPPAGPADFFTASLSAHTPPSCPSSAVPPLRPSALGSSRCGSITAFHPDGKFQP